MAELDLEHLKRLCSDATYGCSVCRLCGSGQQPMHRLHLDSCKSVTFCGQCLSSRLSLPALIARVEEQQEQIAALRQIATDSDLLFGAGWRESLTDNQPHEAAHVQCTKLAARVEELESQLAAVKETWLADDADKQARIAYLEAALRDLAELGRTQWGLAIVGRIATDALAGRWREEK